MVRTLSFSWKCPVTIDICFLVYSPFILLADNVNNPFNEYLLVLVNYGLAGLSLLLVLLVLLFKRLKSLSEAYKPLMIGMTVGVMTWSFFSYPFSVPFVWVIVSLILIVAFFPYVCNHYAKAGITLSLLCVVGLFMSIPVSLHICSCACNSCGRLEKSRVMPSLLI